MDSLNCKCRTVKPQRTSTLHPLAPHRPFGLHRTRRAKTGKGTPDALKPERTRPHDSPRPRAEGNTALTTYNVVTQSSESLHGGPPHPGASLVTTSFTPGNVDCTSWQHAQLVLPHKHRGSHMRSPPPLFDGIPTCRMGASPPNPPTRGEYPPGPPRTRVNPRPSIAAKRSRTRKGRHAPESASPGKRTGPRPGGRELRPL